LAEYFAKSLKDATLPLDEDRVKIAVKDLDKKLTAEESMSYSLVFLTR